MSMNNDEMFITSTADVIFRNPRTKDIMFIAQTLMDSTLKQTIKNKEVRGGYLNPIQWEYSYDKTLEAVFKDCAFKLEYWAIQNGTKIQSVIKECFQLKEKVTIKNGKGTLKHDPIDPRIHVLYSNGDVEKVVAVGKEIEVKRIVEGEVRVTYVIKELSDNMEVSAESLPEIYDVTLVAKYNKKNGERGEIQINIPQFKIKGNFTIELKADGVCAPTIEGKAMADSFQNYAYVTRRRENYIETMSFETIVPSPSVVKLAQGETKGYQIIGVQGSSYENMPITADMVEIKSEDEKIAKVNGTEVTFVSGGKTNIVISLKNDKALQTSVYVICEDSKAVAKKLTV